MNGDENLKSLKWICLGVALALLTAFAVTGTFGDDDADNSYLNIVQSELERTNGGLREVQDDRELLPVADAELNKENVLLKDSFSVTGKKGNTVAVSLNSEEQMYSAENVLDHIVVVTNTGNISGNVRTWFAFEMGELTEEEFKAAVHLNQNSKEWDWGDFSYDAEIGGVKYAVVCAEYNAKLEKERTTAPNLLQIYLHSDVSDDIVSRLDGDHDGKYTVMAYSQIVSDADAWGEVGKPWDMN